MGKPIDSKRTDLSLLYNEYVPSSVFASFFWNPSMAEVALILKVIISEILSGG